MARYEVLCYIKAEYNECNLCDTLEDAKKLKDHLESMNLTKESLYIIVEEGELPDA
jgi:hypothetical protein|tara:strand:- start:199 stop:366 length:168 start_codon:yes stop_codon:yes gene_type:complete